MYESIRKEHLRGRREERLGATAAPAGRPATSFGVWVDPIGPEKNIRGNFNFFFSARDTSSSVLRLAEAAAAGTCAPQLWIPRARESALVSRSAIIAMGGLLGGTGRGDGSGLPRHGPLPGCGPVARGGRDPWRWSMQGYHAGVCFAFRSSGGARHLPCR